MADRNELTAAAQADHDGYIRECVRLRDRVVAMRGRLEAQTVGINVHPACEYSSCPAVGTQLRAIEALGSEYVIDHAPLHHAFDLAEAHLDGR